MNHALELFTAVPKCHNCAQAVVCGCGREDLKNEMASCGGGRAPGGICGAAWGAAMIVPEEKRQALLDEFAEKFGSNLCRELKTVHKIACADCVEAGAELAEKYQA